MKAIFIAMQGALIEGSGPRCTLRCGAGAGLALLLDLDYRLIVVDGGDGGDDGAYNSADSGVGKVAGGLYERAGDGVGAITDKRGYAPSPAAPPRSPLPTGHGGHRPARLLPPVAPSWPQPCRLPDNGRRRRSSDPAVRAGDGVGHFRQRTGPAEVAGTDADADLIVEDGSDKCEGNRWSGANTWDAGDSKSVGVTWGANALRSDGLDAQTDGNAGAGTGRANKDLQANRHDWTAANIWKSAGVGDPGNAWRTGSPPNEAAVRACGDDAGAPMPTPVSQSPSTRAGQIKDRLGDLLFRERLALQAYYRCNHADGLVRAARHGAVLGAAAPGSMPYRCHYLAPQPGLLLQAAVDHGIDLAASWMIGATLDEVEAGNRAGCRTVMIDSGLETNWRLGRSRVPTRIAPDLYTAALLISEAGNRHADRSDGQAF